MYLKLAWRNTFRNRRRTFITAGSVFMAVILALAMRSAQIGAYDRMIDNVVSFYTGHVQVHAQGYWEEKVLDNSFEIDTVLSSALSNQAGIRNWAPRLESFALISIKDLTKGVMVVGIDPEAEDNLTRVKSKLTSGIFPAKNGTGMVIAEGLAENLGIATGDTVVVLGQGYHGVSAAGKYPVTGLVRFSSPELNKSMTYLPLHEAQSLYGTGNRLTSIVIAANADVEASVLADSIRAVIGNNEYEVMDWREMLPEMVQLIEVDNAGGVITISILYMIIAFGIFGTILMMLAERRHEFAILVAVGMKKLQLGVVVVLEILIMAGIGVIAGIACGIPLISYFHKHPIHVSGEMAEVYEQYGMEPVFPFSNDSSIYLSQAAVVFSLSLILSLYPLISLLKFKTIKGLKS